MIENVFMSYSTFTISNHILQCQFFSVNIFLYHNVCLKSWQPFSKRIITERIMAIINTWQLFTCAVRNMAVTGFSDDGKYFSVLNDDGRLKIWDTETSVLKQEYTPDLHLSAPVSCLQWISLGKVSHSQKKKKKRKSSESDVNASAVNKNEYVAFGTTNGKILLYSISQAKVEFVLIDEASQELKNNNITSLDWNIVHGFFSSTVDGIVYEWDLNACIVRNKYNVNDNKLSHNSKITAIKIVPSLPRQESKLLLTASSQVKLWDLHSRAVLRSMVGHSSSVHYLDVLLCNAQSKMFAVSGSKNERLISFWDITQSENTNEATTNGIASGCNRKSAVGEAVNATTPAHSFLLEDLPQNISCRVVDVDGASRIQIVTVMKGGSVQYHGHTLNGASSKKPIKPTLTIQVTTDKAKPMPVRCCRIASTADDLSDGQEFVVGYEPAPARLIFERVKTDLKKISQVLVRKNPYQDNSRKAAQRRLADEATKTKSGLVPESVDARVTYLEPGGGIVPGGLKRSAPGKGVQVPMESRLANLEIDTGTAKGPVNQNLTKLLVQGLHSKDKELILSVLLSTDPQVAMRTTSRLPPQYVNPLLDELREMTYGKTSKCKAVCVWLRALLRQHSALLLSTASSTSGQSLASLLAAISQRRLHLAGLLMLRGRIDLTVSQKAQTGDDKDESGIALLDYVDDSSDDANSMDLDYNEDSASNHSWNEQDIDESSDENAKKKDEDNDMSTDSDGD